MIRTTLLRPGAIALCATLALPAAAQDRTPAPEGARAYIISPENGATVSNPVTIRFGLEGMGVAPAGTMAEGTGHHHLIINVPQEDYDFSVAVPADDAHIHFGGGQTEVTLDLPAGEHSLWLLLGDAAHLPHDPPVMSEPIAVTVQP
ncbi:DUF4399 domain-containing protein [Rhodovulum euryhalinum]|uniref:Uncharacterized protein DUF4399 n=1 Tax=Rhodovulum euryhalinum TaxID=35805 RepID=A0A4R2KLT1_9RHOB|nr:DUF4399 domain-containing protein [Rhodovulum euryhalinum]TCO73487.1 uncharacterized protein DUF4399 [Rhodovulum euryhalinum]